jgi:hypothetical protein
MRPATKKSSAPTNCTHPETRIPAYFFMDHPISGHAARPENNANHPFVGGHGPLEIRSLRPPPAAPMVQAQPAIWPSREKLTSIDLNNPTTSKKLPLFFVWPALGECKIASGLAHRQAPTGTRKSAAPLTDYSKKTR